MKLIKPAQLGLLTRPYSIGLRHRLAVGVIGFFRLGEDRGEFLPEAEQWAKAMAALPAAKALDEVFPKTHGELLLAGHAHAPLGRPVAQLDVSVRLGTAARSIRVWGDRRRAGGQWCRLTPAAPFISIPLVAGRAYGGPGHAENPEGCGYVRAGAGVAGLRMHGAMPNLLMPDKPKYRYRQVKPILLGPLDTSRAPRRAYAGTYDQAWVDNIAPGLPVDIDPRFFQTAPAEQWRDGPWRGDEVYRLVHLHPQYPVLAGQLPGLAARAFARSKMDGKVHEIAMALDTVWFLPDQLLGVAIYHGALDVADCDALDIDAVLAACERLGEARSAAHYEAALVRRTDAATAAFDALCDGPLIPEESAELRSARAAAGAIRQREKLVKRQAVLDEMLAEQWQRSGMAPPPGFEPPKVEPSPFELDLEAVRAGDVDLGAWVAQVKEQAEQKRKEAMARLAESDAEGKTLSTVGGRQADAEQDKQRIYARASEPAWDLLNVAAAPPPELGEALDRAMQSGAIADPAALDAARAQLAKLPALKRQGRRAALKPSEGALAPALATWLGEHVRQWRLGGICLAGRDLSGADLRDIDLADADLRETIFEGCDLRGAHLAGANLRAANLVGAQLDGADFTGCQLATANLSASVAHGACFNGANLSKAWAIEADLKGSAFDGAILDGLLALRAVLTGARFRQAHLERALLLEVQAADSCWQGAKLVTSNLLKADLRRAVFSEASLKRCVLLDAMLDDGDWRGARLERCLVIGAKLRRVRASGLRSKDSGWRGTDWTDADLSGALCADSDFGNATLRRTDLQDGVFARCIFQGTTLAEARGAKADFWQALARRADFRGADLRDVNLRRVALQGACFDDADLRGAQIDPPQSRKLKQAPGVTL